MLHPDTVNLLETNMNARRFLSNIAEVQAEITRRAYIGRMNVGNYFAINYAWIALFQDSDALSNEIAYDVAVSAGIVFC